MRALPKFLAAFFFLSALGSAQMAPYADAGIGVNGLGFQSPYYDADVGVDWGSLRPTFYEAEVGADTANPNGINNGTTFRAEGVVLWRTSPHWRLGGGIHFSDLFIDFVLAFRRRDNSSASFERRVGVGRGRDL